MYKTSAIKNLLINLHCIQASLHIIHLIESFFNFASINIILTENKRPRAKMTVLLIKTITEISKYIRTNRAQRLLAREKNSNKSKGKHCILKLRNQEKRKFLQIKNILHLGID